MKRTVVASPTNKKLALFDTCELGRRPLANASQPPALALPLYEVLRCRALEGVECDDVRANDAEAGVDEKCDEETRGWTRRTSGEDVEQEEDSPGFRRPPFATLVVETVGLCHYLGFASRQRRDRFQAAIALAMRCIRDAPRANELEMIVGEQQQQQHSWQSHSQQRDPRDAFVLKPCAYRGERLVLNARRLRFDLVKEPCHSPQPRPWEVSVMLLRRVFQLTPDADEHENVAVFDMASSVRAIPLAQLDEESPAAALCFFLNLHHALLQHALHVLGAPSRNAEVHAFSTQVSYDALGDVFSLNELQHCLPPASQLRYRVRVPLSV